jgi:hypothetical protein
MLVSEAIARSQSRSAPMPIAVRSYWLSTILREDGTVEAGLLRGNLTTDTASGFTNRRDWQSKAFGDFGTTAFATNASNATATTSTTLTNSGATFPTAGQGLAGKWVAACPNASGAGSKVLGYILSNTGTALTVDQWTDPTSTTAAAGTTPNATCSYIIIPGQAPAAWLAVTSDATTSSSADTTLASEATTNGFARAIATYAHTAAASTYTLVHLWTASGALTVKKEAVFGAQNGGVMPFESDESPNAILGSGDTLQNTVTVTI